MDPLQPNETAQERQIGNHLQLLPRLRSPRTRRVDDALTVADHSRRAGRDRSQPAAGVIVEQGKSVGARIIVHITSIGGAQHAAEIELREGDIAGPLGVLIGEGKHLL